jgi:hypothetical protein
MSRKYIRENRNSFSIVKGSRTYAKLDNLEDAVFIRDLLAENDWNADLLGETYEVDGEYVVVGIIDERVHILARLKEMPSQKTVDGLVKERMRNPNGSRYGLNITKVFDTFVIKKRIAGDDYIFGYYDSLEDAEFVRNHLLDNMWDVRSFSEIQYDGDMDNYKVIEVIDDRVYVLDSFQDENEIDLPQVRREFLNRITKHKLGLASHDYLNELTDMIPDLEKRFAIEAKDDVWDFRDTENPLNDVIFNLTPFQKSVYDAVDNSTVWEIERSLLRFKSKNFTQKIQKNLDELEKKGLIVQNQNRYIKKET